MIQCGLSVVSNISLQFLTVFVTVDTSITLTTSWTTYFKINPNIHAVWPTTF